MKLEERQTLIALLIKNPDFQTFEGRKTILNKTRCENLIHVLLLEHSNLEIIASNWLERLEFRNELKDFFQNIINDYSNIDKNKVNSILNIDAQLNNLHNMNKEIEIIKESIEMNYDILEESYEQRNTGSPQQKARARKQIPKIEKMLNEDKEKLINLVERIVKKDDKEKIIQIAKEIHETKSNKEKKKKGSKIKKILEKAGINLLTIGIGITTKYALEAVGIPSNWIDEIANWIKG